MTRSLRRFSLACSAAGTLLLLGALPAQAGDEFERAFKYELGRIAAHEAVGLGRHVLVEVTHGGYRQPHRARRHYRGSRYDYGRYRAAPRHPKWRKHRWSRYDAWDDRDHRRYRRRHQRHRYHGDCHH